MERENRYLVFKRKDINQYLSDAEQMILSILAAKVSQYRTLDDRPEHSCVVVEEDWPEYEPTWKAIEARMDATPQEVSDGL